MVVTPNTSPPLFSATVGSGGDIRNTEVTFKLIAIASIITSLGVLISGLAVFIPSMKALRRDVKEVHTIVNQSATDTKNYQAALIRALVAHDIEVPIDQSEGNVTQHD